MERKESALEKKKRYIIKRIRKSKYFAIYLYMLLVMLLMTSVASYAWFTISRRPTVKDMQMYITSAYGLELSVDPVNGTWGQQVDFWDTEELIKFKDTRWNFQRPVIQQITWSEENDAFYAPVYGYDGRLVSFFNEYPEENRYVVGWHPLEDKSHANKATWLEGYYMKATVYARSGQITNVTLAPTEENTAVTPRTYVAGKPNTGRGPETAVRMGFRMTDVTVDGAGNIVEIPETRSELFVYEPNCDVHADGTTDKYIPTDSIDNEPPPGGEIWELPEDPFPLVPEERLIRQKFPAWGNRNEPGEFETNPVLFDLKPGEIVKIEIYLWLEGQDVDCSNIMQVESVDIADDAAELEKMESQAEEDDKTETEDFHLEALIQFVGPAHADDGLESFE